MKTPQCSSPELLAPAGSRECFHAAIDSGADAVYLGLGDFNARLRAKNFTTRDLSVLVPFAHSRNVKVYVTLNTLIKQSEIAPALNVLYQLDQLGVDAVIVADIGLMRLSANNFPNLRIHGSTQAAVHNAYGAEFLKSLGVKRAVLARELSLEEIEETAKKSPIETEVFIHGALCYSMSGMCLASSFIGGASGNRGQCTQVCRRRFKRGGRIKDGLGTGCIDTDNIGTDGISTDNIDTMDGYFFSPNDLQALPFIDRLTNAGVACFKIEGRMKGAEYVSTVVKAYRHVIDFPDDIESAEKLLRFDFGRDKTVFFMDGRRGEAIDPKRPSGTGIFLGTVVECDGGAFSINGINNINTDDTLTIEKNDRLRIHPKDGFEGIACKVASCQVINNNDDHLIKITPAQSTKCATGDSVFLIGKAGINTNINTDIDTSGINTVINIKPTYPAAKRIADSITPQRQLVDTDSGLPYGEINKLLRRFAPLNDRHCERSEAIQKATSTKPTLWFKTDRLQWLDLLTATPCRRLIFDADLGELESLISSPDIIKIWRSRISIALPPFIEEPKLALWRGIVEKCLSLGLRSFTVSNIGHFQLVKGAERIVSDSLLWCLNRFTQAELSASGVGEFVFSWEDEYLNIRDATYPPPPTASGAISGIAPIYGRPPLFISRMKPPLFCGETVVDPHGGSFFVSTKNDLYYTMPTAPVCLFAKRKKLLECGVNDFLIDVSFHIPSYELIGALMSGYKQNIRIDGSTIFNFKAGLK